MRFRGQILVHHIGGFLFYLLDRVDHVAQFGHRVRLQSGLDRARTSPQLSCRHKLFDEFDHLVDATQIFIGPLFRPHIVVSLRGSSRLGTTTLRAASLFALLLLRNQSSDSHGVDIQILLRINVD